MIVKLYAIKDDVAADNGAFKFFGVYLADALAERAFNMAVQSESVPASDLSLYWIADWDINSGEMVLTGDRYICRGKKNEV